MTQLSSSIQGLENSEMIMSHEQRPHDPSAARTAMRGCAGAGAPLCNLCISSGRFLARARAFAGSFEFSDHSVHIKAGLENFHERYSKVVDSWAFFDSYHRPPILIDWSKK